MRGAMERIGALYPPLRRLGLLLLGSAILLLVWRWWSPYAVFDEASWKATNPYEDSTRLGMGNYLVNKRTLIGKLRAQVIEMLGQPDARSKWVGCQMAYRLGSGREFLSFGSYLAIQLGPDEAVQRCYIVED